uniref:Uncharacterized protein n=1 Tax=Salmonella phage PMBT36 TaxID=3229746 RepID=A0AB39C0P0_9CAUD
MQLNQIMLTQLAEKMPNSPHVNYSDDQSNIPIWEKQGRPFLWEHVESANNYHAFFDRGYGWLCIFVGETLLDYGMDEIVRDDVIFLNKGFYYVANSLYFPAN